MGWFSSRKPLPTTTYGYQPPPDATASGWQCNNEGCGTGDSPAPKTWPARCPLCGGPADPDFDEPWREQARGPRLQMFINREGDKFGIYGGGIRKWEYGQALARGDRGRAETIRTETDAWLVTMSRESKHFGEDRVRSMMVSHALAYGEIDGAARELTVWFELVDVVNLDLRHLGDSSSEGSRLRAMCFNLFSAAAAFLDTPSGRAHRSAPAIDAAARYLGSATQHEMPADLRYTWQALQRGAALGAGR